MLYLCASLTVHLSVFHDLKVACNLTTVQSIRTSTVYLFFIHAVEVFHVAKMMKCGFTSFKRVTKERGGGKVSFTQNPQTEK